MAALTNRYEDDDARHLPHGMKRVGYDADTQRYTFRQGDDLWLGEPGSLYGGKMKWAGKAQDSANSRLFSKHEKDNESDEGEDDDSDGFSYTDDKTLEANHATTQSRSSPIQSPPPYTLHNATDWGVPVASMSFTDARPPDSPNRRKKMLFKKAAASTVMAIGVARKLSSKGNRKTNPQRNNSEDEKSGNSPTSPRYP